MRNYLIAAALAVTTASGYAHAEPSQADVARAVETGNYAQADSLMRQVLTNHPNSAKAHYVYAQILADEQMPAAARQELDHAKMLDPSIQFANLANVEQFSYRLGHPNAQTTTTPTDRGTAEADGWVFFWAMLLLLALAALVIVAFSVRNARAEKRQQAERAANAEKARSHAQHRQADWEPCVRPREVRQPVSSAATSYAAQPQPTQTIVNHTDGGNSMLTGVLVGNMLAHQEAPSHHSYSSRDDDTRTTTTSTSTSNDYSSSSVDFGSGGGWDSSSSSSDSSSSSSDW
ncbi:tetratricopeptide repeat protein [Chromobacterium violaceum]|uniref:tetratricopeptide repeat protein n=1 Tax=Chromobacterium violaceum TaxID=536 RepID=UPI001CE086C7|nr:tetratricopeptide repeat protein [Chromobacterium violaceum]